MDNVKPPQQHGLLVLNKPKGPTSARCIEMIKRRCGQKKIGHAGTLDPMAGGVLQVLLGQGTKMAQYLLEGGKTYSGLLTLGMETDTYDMEGQVVSERGAEGMGPAEVEAGVAAWEAMKTQVVPPFSAAKHKGAPLYKIAREGGEVPVKEKEVTISRAEILEMDLPQVRFRVSCGAGTYIRSLVHSLGIRLGCGAVLAELTRERSHPYGLEQAWSLEQVLDEPELLPERVVPLADTLPHWPKLTLSGADAALVRNGGMLPVSPHTLPDVSDPDADGGEAGRRALFTGPEGDPVALVESRLKDGAYVWGILRGL